MEKTYSIDACIGRQIRHLRNQKKVTQEKLGEVLRVSFQQIQKYERGANRISAGNLYTVAQFLGVPVSYFFEELNTAGMGEEQHPFIGANKDTLGKESEIGDKMSLPPVSSSGPHNVLSRGAGSTEIPPEEIEELVRAYRNVKDPTVRHQVLALLNSLSNLLTS